MTTRKAITIIAICALALAAAGVGIGYGLGARFPNYYRSAFRNGREPTFDPIAVGIGQGLTQGAIAGVIGGLVIVALLIWRETRVRRAQGPSSSIDNVPTSSTRVAVWLFALVGTLCVLTFCSTTSWFIGVLWGERDAQLRQYEDEQRLMRPMLAADPAFSHVTIEEKSNGGIFLAGYVATAEDLTRLHAAVLKVLGESRGEEAIRGVEMRP